jgi:orotate phosphoribosyltransferase
LVEPEHTGLGPVTVQVGLGRVTAQVAESVTFVTGLQTAGLPLAITVSVDVQVVGT